MVSPRHATGFATIPAQRGLIDTVYLVASRAVRTAIKLGSTGLGAQTLATRASGPDRGDTPAMNPKKLKRRMARPIRDFLAGLLIFTAVALSGMIELPTSATSWISSAAHARLLEAQAPDAGLRQFLVPATGIELTNNNQQQQQLQVLISLALAFSTLFAMNLWFARHLRHAHAAYRRRRA